MIQFDPNVQPWPDAVIPSPSETWGDIRGWIRTPEGDKAVMSGDWIITVANGDRYLCRDELIQTIREELKKHGR